MPDKSDTDLSSRPRRWEPVVSGEIVDETPEAPRTTIEAAAPFDPNIGRQFGNYRLVRRLGAGGMAVVYLAHREGDFAHEVAIKVLSPEPSFSRATVARFLKEAQAISVIRHPNVVHLIEPPGRTDDGQIYLVMELLDGKPLSDILADMRAAGQVFTWEKLAPLMLQICRALQAAHKQKIVHRDLKPSNCFCTELDDDPWHIKVVDFGIAKVHGGGRDRGSDESLETQLTQDGMFVGTPHFAAPEIIDRRPEHTLDGRADMFSLGVMMYQCLTGTLPFEAYRGDKLAVIFKAARERPEPPRVRAPARDIPPEVDALVMRAMDIDVQRRFANMQELAAAIRATLDPARGGRTTGTSEPPARDDTARMQEVFTSAPVTVVPVTAPPTLKQSLKAPIKLFVIAGLAFVSLAILAAVFVAKRPAMIEKGDTPEPVASSVMPIQTESSKKSVVAPPKPKPPIPVSPTEEPTVTYPQAPGSAVEVPPSTPRTPQTAISEREQPAQPVTGRGARTNTPKPPARPVFCGNAKCERGETNVTCCQDCACADTMTCKVSTDGSSKCIARLKL